MLDDKMIEISIMAERSYSEDQAAVNNVAVGKSGLNLVEAAPTISSLTLSFKKIGKIENLIGFDALVRLRLDNNFIEEIINLGHLKNMKWLDLSFNKIRQIQGIDKLVLLEDLTLFSNKVEIVEGLDHCTNLQCFSLGNNRISSMEQVIKLRQIKNLRMLTLAGNPVCKEPDYRMSIYAFLDSLKYLDYTLIDVNDRATAKEQYHDELLDLEEKESVVQEKEARDRALEEYLSKLGDAGILFAHSLIEDIFVGDLDLERLKHLPGIKEAIEQFRNQFKLQSDEFIKVSLEKFEKKLREIAEFERVLKSIHDRSDSDSTTLIENFSKSKKAVAAQITDPKASLRKKEVAMLLKKLQDELERVCDELMSIEIRQYEKFEALIDEFDNRMVEAKAQALEMQQVFFRQVEEIEEKISASTKAIASDLIDRFGREELAEDYLDDEAMGLVVDKDTCTVVLSSSHDLHVGRILKREDEARGIENRRYQELISVRMTRESARNRDRVLQIHEFSNSMKKTLNSLQSVDEDDNYEDDEVEKK